MVIKLAKLISLRGGYRFIIHCQLVNFDQICFEILHDAYFELNFEKMNTEVQFFKFGANIGCGDLFHRKGRWWCLFCSITLRHGSKEWSTVTG